METFYHSGSRLLWLLTFDGMGRGDYMVISWDKLQFILTLQMLVIRK
jgi:hypothetical protein